MMQICILSGSHRAGSNSLKTANYIAAQLERQYIQPVILDLSEIDIDIWSSDFWASESSEVSQWQPYSKILRESDGFIAVTPEYGGMVPPILKNFLLKCNGHETGNKPIMLVGVSSGMGGTYPLVELRNNGFKNNHLCVIPQAVIVRKVNDCFNDAEPQDEVDATIRNAMNYSLSHLIAYAKALVSVREQGLTDYSKYPYGV